ncbi:MAG: hypothetical protein M3Y85_00290 [Bacteroidota bacterium]|nr:hypothetical protein [Bacteroidota bacterium]
MIKKILVILLLCISNHVFANIKLPAIFSDGMVLQQKTQVAFWGWADAGEEITISNSWSGNTTKTKTGASGKWKLVMQTPSAGGPFNIKINGRNSIELNDVLIGEVWVCSGQSNMVFSLKASEGAKEEIQKADYPGIRYFSVKRQYGSESFNDAVGSVWEKTNAQTAGSFSAVAYFFAKKIHKDLNVPVGIVYAAWGGTPAEAWTPKSILESDNSLQLSIKRWKDMYVTVGKDSTAYHMALDSWERARKSGDAI